MKLKLNKDKFTKIIARHYSKIIIFILLIYLVYITYFLYLNLYQIIVQPKPVDLTKVEKAQQKVDTELYNKINQDLLKKEEKIIESGVERNIFHPL